MKRLNFEEIKKNLSKLPGWDLNDKETAIERKMKFENFTDAVCFLNQVAEIAELENHHPDLHLTDYRYLRIVLSTHSEGGLTKKDFVVAGKVEAVSI